MNTMLPETTTPLATLSSLAKPALPGVASPRAASETSETPERPVSPGVWTPKRLRCGAGGHASARGATPRDKTRQRCTSAKTSPGALYKYQLGGAAGSYPFRAQEYDVEINLSALLSHFDAFPGTQETCRCASRRDTTEVQMAILRRSGYDTGHEAMLRCEGAELRQCHGRQNTLD